MRITAELSLYPLADGYLPRIEAAIRTLENAGGIEVVVRKTAKAVEEYNRLRAAGKNAAIAMHLTC